MHKLFIHKRWFRLLGPMFSGTLVYLLVLLINDAVLFLQEDFLSQELGVCIVLAYVTQEFSRVSLIGFERLQWPRTFVLRMMVQLLGSVVLTMGVVSTFIYVYFTSILLYEPSLREYYVFNAIFSFITVLNVILYWAHYFLFKRNSKKLERETMAVQAIEKDVTSYIMGIHPELLFESLEAMLVTMKKNPMKAEALADDFATVYRYLLAKKKNELVPLHEELNVVEHFIDLCAQLPQRKLRLGRVSGKACLVLPTVLIRILEGIIRTSIPTNDQPLSVDIHESETHLTISYEAEERLQQQLTTEVLASVIQSYRFYSDLPVTIDQHQEYKTIQLPKLHAL